MKTLIQILRRIKRNGSMVYCDSGSGIIQSLAKGEILIDDLNGGAFGFPIADIAMIKALEGRFAIERKSK